MQFKIIEYQEEKEKNITTGHCSAASLIDDDFPSFNLWNDILKNVIAFTVGPQGRGRLIIWAEGKARYLADISCSKEEEREIFSFINLKKNESPLEQFFPGEMVLPHKESASSFKEDLNKKKRPYYHKNRPF